MKNILSSVNKQPPVLSGIDLLKEVCRFCFNICLLADQRLYFHFMTGCFMLLRQFSNDGASVGLDNCERMGLW